MKYSTKFIEQLVAQKKINSSRVRVCGEEDEDYSNSRKSNSPVTKKLDDNTIKMMPLCSTEYHSLFVSEIPELKVNITTDSTILSSIDANNTILNAISNYGTQVGMCGISLNDTISTNIILNNQHNVYTLYLGDFEEGISTNHYILIHILRNSVTPKDKLYIRLSSHGGYLDEASFLINHIKEIFTSNNIVCYVDSYAYSMGAYSFCAFDQRLVYEHSHVMFHDMTSGAMGRSAEMINQINHFEDWGNTIISEVRTKKLLSEKEFDELKKGITFWFDSVEMAKRNICTGVIVDNVLLTNEEFLTFKESTFSNIHEYLDSLEKNNDSEQPTTTNDITVIETNTPASTPDSTHQCKCHLTK